MKINWPWNRGILSYNEVQELRGKISTEEYNDLVLKSLHYYTLWDFITLPFWRIYGEIENICHAVKYFVINCFRFRNVLCKYQGFDFSYDIDFLVEMYRIKIRSFEIGSEFVKCHKELEEIKSIFNDLVWLQINDLSEEYIKVYKNVFKKLQKSYTFWW